MRKGFLNEEGSMSILIVLSIVVVLGFCAFVIDMGVVMAEKSKMQTAVDAAVLAAVADLPDTVKATNTANQYIQLNGYSPSDISISFFDTNKKIRITATKTVEYFFAKIVGMENVDVTQSAAGVMEALGGPFDYALFSGGPGIDIDLQGPNYNIVGGVHSNGDFSMNSNNATITGPVEAVGSITISGTNVNVNNRLPNSLPVNMPEFSDTILAEAQAAGNVFYGNKHFNGSQINLTAPIYVFGDVQFSASQFRGTASICATGNISFSGSNLVSNPDTSIIIYSKGGDISIHTSTSSINGILYAPKGSIHLTTPDMNIYGRVIGNSLDISSSNVNIISGTRELESLPKITAKLVE